MTLKSKLNITMVSECRRFSEMKKILFVYHTSVIGGGSYCLLNIIKAIDQKKYKLMVLLREPGPLVGELKALGAEVFFSPQIRCVPYNSSTVKIWALRNPWSIINSFGPYKKLLREIAPDLVYINTMMLYPYLRPAKKMGIKTAIHVREHWPEKEHIHQRNIAISHIRKYADEIVAINAYSASMIEDAVHHPVIVHDWIDMSERDEPIDLNNVFGEDVSQKKIYLYMGGMQHAKGPLQVISAFTRCVEDKDSRLLVMGIDPKQQFVEKKRSFPIRLLRLLLRHKSKIDTTRASIIDMINSDKRIRCMPNTYMVGNLFRQAYCNLSFFTIPHANLALAESIICGTVNVAAKTPESIEYSNNGELALLYEFGNEEDFAAKIHSLSKCYDQMIEKIRKGSCAVSEMFDRERNSKILNDLIDRTLNNEE